MFTLRQLKLFECIIAIYQSHKQIIRNNFETEGRYFFKGELHKLFNYFEKVGINIEEKGRIKKELIEMQSFFIDFDDYSSMGELKKTELVSILNTVKIDYENNNIELNFDHSFMQALLNSKTFYKVHLKLVGKFKNKNALILYSIFSNYYNVKKEILYMPWVSIETFLIQFGRSGDIYKNFKKKTLNGAFQNLNTLISNGIQKSIYFDVKKEGKKVSHIRLTILKPISSLREGDKSFTNKISSILGENTNHMFTKRKGGVNE